MHGRSRYAYPNRVWPAGAASTADMFYQVDPAVLTNMQTVVFPPAKPPMRMATELPYRDPNERPPTPTVTPTPDLPPCIAPPGDSTLAQVEAWNARYPECPPATYEAVIAPVETATSSGLLPWILGTAAIVGIAVVVNRSGAGRK